MQENLKTLVKGYWDAVPCGTRGIKYPEGSVKYYEAVSANRYKVDYYLPDFCEFGKWRGKRILEVGCGVGSDLCEFARNGAIITGMDLSTKSVELARKRMELYRLTGDVFEGDAEKIPFGENTFDMVYSHGVIHHTANHDKAVSEIYRVLKPSGEIRIMLYHKPSVVILQMYLVYGLFKLRPFCNVDEILANHHESKGTRAYTTKQVQLMFSKFRHVEVKTVVTSYDIRYARNRYLPRFMMRFIPKNFGWNILVRGEK